jgi:hypothetical protein
MVVCLWAGRSLSKGVVIERFDAVPDIGGRAVEFRTAVAQTAEVAVAIDDVQNPLAIALGRAAVEAGHSALFVSATSLLASLARAQLEGKLADQTAFCAKPKLLVADELGYRPLEKQTAHLFFQLVSRRTNEAARSSPPTRPSRSGATSSATR